MASQTLTPAQIYAICIHEGWSGSDAIIATSVALAESGGRAGATHSNSDGSIDYGLFQINHKTPPDWNWADPVSNARIAKKLWDSQGWAPWVTVQTHANQAHVADATQGAAEVKSNTLDSVQSTELHPTDTGNYNWNPINDIQHGLSQGQSAVSGTLGAIDTVKSLADGVTRIAGFLTDRHFWLRLGVGAIGVALAVVGFIIFVTSKTAQHVTSEISKLPPIVPV